MNTIIARPVRSGQGRPPPPPPIFRSMDQHPIDTSTLLPDPLLNLIQKSKKAFPQRKTANAPLFAYTLSISIQLPPKCRASSNLLYANSQLKHVLVTLKHLTWCGTAHTYHARVSTHTPEEQFKNNMGTFLIVSSDSTQQCSM